MLAWERVAAAQDEGGRHFAQRKLLEAADRYVLLTVHVQNEKVRALRADAAFKAFVVVTEQDAAPEAKARAFDLRVRGNVPQRVSTSVEYQPHVRKHAPAGIVHDKPWSR